MFIRKQDYIDLIKEISKLKLECCKLENMNKIVEDRIKGYIDINNSLEVDNANLKELINILENRNNTLDLSVQDLLRENAKLTEWIEKVMHDLGCYQVNESNSVMIPLNRIKNDFGDGHGSESIVLPRITFTKVN